MDFDGTLLRESVTWQFDELSGKFIVESDVDGPSAMILGDLNWKKVDGRGCNKAKERIMYAPTSVKFCFSTVILVPSAYRKTSER